MSIRRRPYRRHFVVDRGVNLCAYYLYCLATLVSMRLDRGSADVRWDVEDSLEEIAAGQQRTTQVLRINAFLGRVQVTCFTPRDFGPVHLSL